MEDPVLKLYKEKYTVYAVCDPRTDVPTYTTRRDYGPYDNE